MFISPTTISVSGVTGSGKTTWLFKVLKHKKTLFTPAPKRILYCYGVWQSAFQTMEKLIDFREGLPSENDLEEYEGGLVVIDDLMDQVVKDERVQRLFVRGSHHRNITVVFVNQNLFCQGKYARTINLNTHYVVLLKNPRDVGQIQVLGRQIGLGKTLVLAYQDAMKTAYGYLVVDLSPHGEDEYKLTTRIFPDEDKIVYL